MKRLLFTTLILLNVGLAIAQPHDYIFCYGNISLTLFANGTVEQVRYDFNGDIVRKVSGKYKIYGEGNPTELLKISFDISDLEYSYDLIRDGLGYPAHIFDRQGRQYDICKITGLESETQSSNKLDVFKKITEISASDMYTFENKITSAQDRIASMYSDIDNKYNKRYTIPDRLNNLEETEFFKNGFETKLNASSQQKLQELRNVSKIIEKENVERTGNKSGKVNQRMVIDTLFIDDKYMEIKRSFFFPNGYKDNEANFLVYFNNGSALKPNPVSGKLEHITTKQIGTSKRYYENGQLRHKISYNNDGLLEGLWINYEEDGQIASYTNYKNGEKEGASYSTIGIGRPDYLNYYKNGKLDSLQFTYSDENFNTEGYDLEHPYSVAMYKSGILVYKEVYFYNNDRTIKHIEYKEYYPAKDEYSSEIQVKSEGLLDSKKNKIGKWKYYKYYNGQGWISPDFRGELIREENY